MSTDEFMVYKYKNNIRGLFQRKLLFNAFSSHMLSALCLHADRPGNGLASVTITGAQMSLIYMV
jgi:hypothetical protein